ncbi:diacylglycerol/lipid kinase family protein [Microbacterium excoecariae]|uniref:diacylglycerol/lipid kinase family protein n=1 Tax=Microbacterium excoecariae TaxID=2715210 RepID=UPI00140C5677|nr:diacylglycerol kinase family protein [Microbacterium excoecariae]NHI15882.1 diacylglycerol kinase [Microbacterium excoecariae]
MTLLGPGDVAILANPRAGAGRAVATARAARERLARAGIAATILTASTAAAVSSRVRAARDGSARAVVAVGGDGIAHLAIQELARGPVPFGIIPVGTGNDFARTLAMPRDPDAAVSRVVTAVATERVRDVDLLRVHPESGSDVWVAGATSAGLDAAVNARANGMSRPRGASRYVWAALRELAGYRAWDYEVAVRGMALSPEELDRVGRFPGVVGVTAEQDGGGYRVDWRARGALVTLANGPTIGGGIPIAPRASATDGRADLVLAGDVGRRGAFPLFARMLVGRHTSSARVLAGRARGIDIAAGGGAPLPHGDGEPLPGLPLRVRLVPGALRVLG